MSLATVAAPVFVARWVWSYFRPSEGNVKNKTTYSAVVSLAHAILYFFNVHGVYKWIFYANGWVLSFLAYIHAKLNYQRRYKWFVFYYTQIFMFGAI